MEEYIVRFLNVLHVRSVAAHNVSILIDVNFEHAAMNEQMVTIHLSLLSVGARGLLSVSCFVCGLLLVMEGFPRPGPTPGLSEVLRLTERFDPSWPAVCVASITSQTTFTDQLPAATQLFLARQPTQVVLVQFL